MPLLLLPCSLRNKLHKIFSKQPINKINSANNFVKKVARFSQSSFDGSTKIVREPMYANFVNRSQSIRSQFILLITSRYQMCVLIGNREYSRYFCDFATSFISKLLYVSTLELRQIRNLDPEHLNFIEAKACCKG